MVATRVALFFGCLCVMMLTSSADKSGDSETNIANTFTNFNKFGQNLGSGSFPGAPGGQGLSGFSPEAMQDLVKLANDPCTMKTINQFNKLFSDVRASNNNNNVSG